MLNTDFYGRFQQQYNNPVNPREFETYIDPFKILHAAVRYAATWRISFTIRFFRDIFEGTNIVAVISSIRTPVKVTHIWLLCYVHKGTPNCAIETIPPCCQKMNHLLRFGLAYSETIKEYLPMTVHEQKKIHKTSLGFTIE